MENFLIDTSFNNSPGAQIINTNLLKNFLRYKNQKIIIIKNYKIYFFKKKKLYYQDLKRTNSKFIWYFFEINKIIKKYKIKKYFSFCGHLPFFKKKNVQYLMSINNMLPFELKKIILKSDTNFQFIIKYFLLYIIYKFNVSKASKVIFFSKSAKKIVSKSLNSNNNTKVILTGYNKFKFNKKNRKNFLVYHSSFKSYKNHKVIVEAYKILKNKGFKLPKIYFLGKLERQDIDHFNLLSKLIGKYNLRSSIHFKLGKNNKQTVNYLLQSNYAIFPSICETNSIALMEIIATRTPCLVANIDANKEVAKHYATYFNPFNAFDLSKKIYNLILLKQKKKNKKKNYSFVNNKITWESWY